MTNLYKQYLRLLQKWPVDNLKSKDLGQHIRNEIKIAFSKGNDSTIKDIEKCQRYYESLERLASNYYGNKYPCTFTTTATGIKPEHCSLILSPEIQEILQQKKLGYFARFKQKLRNIFSNKIPAIEINNKYFKVSTRLCSTQSLLNRSCESKIESCNNTQIHVPVMVEETLKYLNLSPGDTIIDMTFGAGGHSRKILESVPDVKIFALDRDEVAITCAKKLAEQYAGQVIPLVGRFSELLSLLKSHNVKKNSIDGILFDFGCSSMQFNTPARGFMISKNGPLDMRMDGFRCPDNPTAADILAKIEEKDLYCILKCYGEEKRAKKIARAIIDARYTFRNLRTTHELAQLVESLFPDETNVDSLGRFQHSATKTFQALRIFVNNELNEINYAMIIADKLLKISGRLVTISFHSLEDTIVKRHLFGNVKDGMANQLPLKYINYGKTWENEEDVKDMTETSWKMLHKHVLMASNKEVSMNPRSRSAKFRGIIKIK